MERNIISVGIDESILDILNKINENKVGYIPVVDDNMKLAGLVTRSSLLTVLSRQFLDEEVAE